jgi:long-chain acyl-CoA synthetase
MLLKVLQNTPTINFILHDGPPSSEVVDKIRKLRSDNPIKVIHIDELRSMGRAHPASILETRRPNKDTTACIMYTSGSTGAPKGVCLTHGNLVAAVGAMYTVFGPHIPPGDRFLAYLPLAHVLEYVVELCAIFAGVTCGYARPKTLTDASVRNCQGDLSAFRPNVMFGVPAVWEMIRKAAMGKVNKSGFLARNAFYLALGVKKWLGPYVAGVNWAVDATVLRKVKEAVGGHINFAVNGGAAISRDTQEFFNLAVMPLTQGMRVSLSVLIFSLGYSEIRFEGYGLTETCGMCAFLPPELLTYGPVGIPAPCVEIKLLDCPDLGYFSSMDSPSSPSSSTMACVAHLPQGEILLRGASVTKGYFARDDLNGDENIFTKDGWFRTGDVGQWNADGTLSLIDRWVLFYFAE